MKDNDPFVTVLRTSNADHVQAVVAALRSEGIPCEHPGLNHAGLIPGFDYVEIQLRVPTSPWAGSRSRSWSITSARSVPSRCYLHGRCSSSRLLAP